MMDVVALGELLVDFTYNGISNQGNGLYEANPGGAPCNVLAMLQKLGRKTAFIGKVGRDSFGEILTTAVREQGIQIDSVRYDDQVHTTLAFVHTKPDGDRSFSFYRNPGADMMLTADEVNADLIRDAKIFHYGTLSMTAPGVEEATRYAIETAKAAGVLCSFDPNLRPPLWDSLETAKEKIAYGLSQCDILKISDNEIEFMTGETDIEKGVSRILEKYPIPFVCATMGRDGSKAFFDGKVAEGKAFLRDDTVETTGAGDTFCGCMLDFVLSAGVRDLDPEKVRGMLAFANAAASLITTRKGALRVMPEREEVTAMMSQR